MEQRKGEPSAALVAANDNIAFGSIRALKAEGYGIPEDVSVIGFDNLPFCEVSDPRLTTISVHQDEIGKLAVKRMLEILGGSAGHIQKPLIGTDLIQRDSVCVVGPNASEGE